MINFSQQKSKYMEEAMPKFKGVLKDNDFLSIKNIYRRENLPFVDPDPDDLLNLNL